MKLDRFRAPTLAAAAVIMISGAGIAFAGSPAGSPSAAAPGPVAPIVQAEPTGPDTDTLQEGDQTTPDAAGAAETAGEAPEGSEAVGAESDGPGGHEDPAGQNADHQFDGEE